MVLFLLVEHHIAAGIQGAPSMVERGKEIAGMQAKAAIHQTYDLSVRGARSLCMKCMLVAWRPAFDNCTARNRNS
jgi:hypothetical protein